MEVRELCERIGSCNVAGFTKEKLRLFRDNFEKLDIVCLQETHGVGKNCKSRIAKLGFTNGIFSLHTNASRGAAVMWRDSVKQIGDEWTHAEGRVAAVALQNEDGHKGLVVSVYAPNLDPSPSSQAKYVSFLITLEHVLSEMTSKIAVDSIFLMGDFNLIIDPTLDSQSASPKLYKVPLEALQEVLRKYELYDAFRSLHPTEIAFTFSRRGALQKDGSRLPPIMNRLDYAFVKEFTLERIRNCEHKEMALTDHKMVWLDSSVEPPKNRKLLGLWKHNDLLNRDTSFVKMMSEKLGNFIPIAQAECSNYRGAWEAIKGKAREWSRAFSIEKMRKEREEKKTLWDRMQNTSSKPSRSEREMYLEAKLKYDEICKREARRLIFRAKVDSLQHDEKFSKYFFLKIRQNRAQSNIAELNIDGDKVTDQARINSELKSFYKDLYRSDVDAVPDVDWLGKVHTLSDDEREALERPLSMNEISNGLFKHMKVGKSPGNDGLTVEFYRTFWKELRDPLLKALREGITAGEMSFSQKQSVIRLIPKKGKDLALVKNWRPISLMNVDAKLLSKALTFRLEKHLYKLTSKEQTAFVKGRLLQDNIHSIGQAITYAVKNKRAAQIFSIDFKKAFDSLEHSYLWEVLRSMNIGETFIGMVKTLYCRAESTVMNNGVATGYFPLERAARQGDPISPTLFILALEPLLRVLKEEIKGIPTPKGVFKLSAYADDVTVGLGELDDVDNVIKLLSKFGRFSGLKINIDKCEIMSLNGKITANKDIKETSCIKITGVYFGNSKNIRDIEKLNFDPVIQSIRSKLNLWKMRSLTLIGKITVIKAHALSQLQFLASSVRTPDWAIEETAELIYRFVWNGKSRMNKLKASKEWKAGGINLPRIVHLCKAARVKMTLRACEMEEVFLWAANFVHEIRKVGGTSVLHPQTNLFELKKRHLPMFVLQQIEDWHFLQKILDPKWSKEITIHSPVCFNNAIKAPGPVRSKKPKVLETPLLWKSGATTVGHWFDSRAERVKWQTAKDKGLSNVAIFEWQKVYKALRIANIKLRNDTRTVIESNPSFTPYFHTKNGDISLSNITQKRILYEIAQTVEYVPNGTQMKIQEELGLEESDLTLAFKKFRTDNPCTRKQEFQFKLLSGLVYTNKQYKVFGHKSSSNCTFCNKEKQDFVHTYIKCPEVISFRRKIAEKWLGEAMDQKRWFLGCSDTNDLLEKSKNIIAKEANHFVFKKNWAGETLSVEAFKRWLISEEEPEEALASRINKMFDHQSKWANIQLLLLN